MLETALDALAKQRRPLLQRQRPITLVQGRRLRAEGGDHETVLKDDGTLPRRRANRKISRLFAEGDDLQDIEEREVLEVAIQAQESAVYTAEKISSATRGSEIDRSTTPASTAALDIP